MKKVNFYWIVLLVIIFDFLFYKQEPGVNAFIFNLVFLMYCTLRKPSLLKQKKWVLIACCTLVSTLFVGLYSDVAAVLSSLISFSLLAAYTAEKHNGIITALPSAAISYLRAPWMALKALRIQIIDWQFHQKHQKLLKIGIIALVIGITIVFFIFYRNSSVLFYNLTSKIKLEFISFFFICFTLNAFLLYLAFHYYRPVKKLAQWLDEPEKKILPVKSIDESKLQLEQYAGILLLVLLNALLLIVNSLDLGYILSKKLPEGISYSQFIHQGVGTLIASIAFAIGIILYFFRSELNFSRNIWLKFLVYTWIFQNIFIVFTNVLRNSMYIEAYGLTERRIGVYYYLALSVIGLLLIFIKIFRKYTNAHYIRVTTWVFFIVLLVSCPIPWNSIIVRHNLQRSDANKNFYYLLSCGNYTLPLMLNYSKTEAFKNDTTYERKLAYLHQRTLEFMRWANENSSWKSFNYAQYKTLQSIRNMEIPEIKLEENDFNISYIKELKSVKKLSISHIKIDDVSSWKNLDQLKEVQFTGCNLNDLKVLYLLKNIEKLELKNCTITNYDALQSLRNLKELHISSLSSNDFERLTILLPHVKILRN